MRQIEAARKMIKVKVLHDGQAFTMTYGGGKVKAFKGSPENFAKFLRKIDAKDAATTPKSKRNYTYMAMVNDIISKQDNEIWVWSNRIPKGITSVPKGETTMRKAENKYKKKEAVKDNEKEIIVLKEDVLIGDYLVEAGEKIQILS